jgi:hypothetical protein
MDATAKVEISNQKKNRQERQGASAAKEKQNEAKKKSEAKQNKAKQVLEWDSPGTCQRMHHFRMPPKLEQCAGVTPRLAPHAPPLLCQGLKPAAQLRLRPCPKRDTQPVGFRV